MPDPPKQDPSDGPAEEDLEYEREERLGIQGAYDRPVDLTFPPEDDEGEPTA